LPRRLRAIESWHLLGLPADKKARAPALGGTLVNVSHGPRRLAQSTCFKTS
jgi:hypothetical protein